jgi:hypothetical protein
MKSLNFYKNLFPSFCILFIIITSPLITSQYPGGSIKNIDSIGFDWTGNYWCHLYEETALNGDYNTARLSAVISSLLLSVALISFFLITSRLNNQYKTESKIITFFGLIGVFFTPLGMTKHHDIGVILAGSLCAIAVLAILNILRKQKKYFLWILGYSWSILFLINYWMFFKDSAITYLPLLQKISFSLFFGWIILVNYNFVKDKN